MHSACQQLLSRIRSTWRFGITAHLLLFVAVFSGRLSYGNELLPNKHNQITSPHPESQNDVLVESEPIDEAWVNDPGLPLCAGAGCTGCDGCCTPGIFPNDSPPGILQRWFHQRIGTSGIWSAEVDALLLWRNAPPSRSLVNMSSGANASVLNASQLESAPAAGPRFRLLHSHCSGTGAEFVYLRAFNFRALDELPTATTDEYLPDSLLKQPSTPFSSGTANLGSAIQTFEANGRTPLRSGNLFFLAGFRWLEWQEHFSLDTSTATASTSYGASTINSLYGGQLGLEALLFTAKTFQIDTFFKGGAYYNNVAQHTSYITDVPGSSSVTTALNGSPASGAFVGELGINGSIFLSDHALLRFGYTAFWLENIALATRQLDDPTTLVSNGNTILQGLQIGLEGHW
jgi:hypothetical protein